MSITARDNFRRMMMREGAAWLPVDLQFTPPVYEQIKRELGAQDPVEHFKLDFRCVWVRASANESEWREAYKRLGVDLPENAEVGWAGITHLRPPAHTIGKAHHLREMIHPLAVVENVAQLEQLPWPSPCGDARESLRAQVEQAHSEGRAVVGGAECTIFEPAWYLRGMENLFIDLLERNGISVWLLDWFMNRSIHSVQTLCAAGVDVIGLGDDVGTQRGMIMSPDLWRRHLKPRLARVVRAIRSAQRLETFIRYHSDGDIRPIIPDLIEIGIDILNPVQPECMPVDELIAEHGRGIGFWGMIGIQTVMPFGTPGQVRTMVQRCAQRVRQGAAIVVAPTHVLEPDVPIANIIALVNAVRDVTFEA